MTLPYRTLETRRYLNGALVGAIQAPIVITGGIKPGQTRQFAYAPAGDMRATAWSVALAPVAQDGGSLAGLAELRGATGAEKLAANCQGVDLAAAEAALQRVGTFDPSGLDLQLKEAAEPLARSHGEAFVRAVGRHRRVPQCAARGADGAAPRRRRVRRLRRRGRLGQAVLTRPSGVARRPSYA